MTKPEFSEMRLEIMLACAAFKHQVPDDLSYWRTSDPYLRVKVTTGGTIEIVMANLVDELATLDEFPDVGKFQSSFGPDYVGIELPRGILPAGLAHILVNEVPDMITALVRHMYKRDINCKMINYSKALQTRVKVLTDYIASTCRQDVGGDSINRMDAVEYFKSDKAINDNLLSLAMDSDNTFESFLIRGTALIGFHRPFYAEHLGEYVVISEDSWYLAAVMAWSERSYRLVAKGGAIPALEIELPGRIKRLIY